MTRRRPATFRQRDLTRAIRAVKAAGLSVGRVLVDKSGRIEVTIGDPSHNATALQERNEWDAI